MKENRRKLFDLLMGIAAFLLIAFLIYTMLMHAPH
jgi:hypothetical protein